MLKEMVKSSLVGVLLIGTGLLLTAITTTVLGPVLGINVSLVISFFLFIILFFGMILIGYPIIFKDFLVEHWFRLLEQNETDFNSDIIEEIEYMKERKNLEKLIGAR